jgi:hypothetical protein
MLLGLAFGLSLGLTGCSGPSAATAPGTMPEAFPNHSADQIRQFIRQPTDTLTTFAGEARVSVRTPQQNRSFNADVRQRRADSLFMRFSLFGMEGGRMLLTPDSVFFYDSRNRSLRVGPLADAQSLLPVPVATGEVFANMLGLIAPNDGTDWTVEADSALYYLSDPTGRRQWTIDPTRWRVVRYTEEATDGTVLEKRHFSDFRLVRGVVVPHQVIFRRPPENLMARIDYDTIRLNPSDLSFGLGVPSSVPRRPLRGR